MRKLLTNEEIVAKKEAKRLSSKEYYKNNPEKAKEARKIYRENNPDKFKEIGKNYRKANPNKNKLWKKANPEKVKEIKNRARNKNRENNPHIIAWRTILKNSLKRLGQPKEGHTIDLLSYSATDLKNHMISLFTEGMSWDNHGDWHIDHIKPVSKFDKDTHPCIVNALSNLRPLWATTREINGVIYEGNLNRG